ncbi:MAG TPA: prepilin peptidase [Candidatus Woesebacteria bacterium]|nr:prepilin peptidase [Candidatus Woesebacteria bacterium]
MEIYFGVIKFLLGLCLGSFVNMLTYRTALRYEITRNKLQGTNQKRSFCDHCGKQLKWFDNVPLLSWLLLKGKSRCCDKKLSISYPLVELLLGILFLVSDYWLWPIEVFLVFSLVFDLKYMILPDFSTYILIGWATIFNHFLLASLGSFLFLLILYLVTKGKGIGFGDVKLAIFMGMFLGFPKILVAYYLAFIIGAIIGVILIILKIKKRTDPIPFGPFLIGATGISWWWGDKLMEIIKIWL